MIGKQVAFTERDREIVRHVSRFGLITKDQLIRLGIFQSNTRAKERLKRLVGAGYLTVRAQPISPGGPRFVYLPGPAIVHTQHARRWLADVSNLFVSHELGMVDIYLAFERTTTLKKWLVGKDLTAWNFGIVPDAYCEYEVEGRTFCAFLEYDRGTETLARIERKARAYADLAFSGRFEKTLGRKFFRVFVVVDSNARGANVSTAISRVTDRIFWVTTLTALSQDGPMSSIWRKPGTDDCQPLTVA